METFGNCFLDRHYYIDFKIIHNDELLIFLLEWNLINL